jgi:transposase
VPPAAFLSPPFVCGYKRGIRLVQKKKALTNHTGEGGGRPTQVPAETFVAFKTHLEGLAQKHFTHAELQNIFKTFSGGYVYSHSYFCHLLREKLDMLYYKPEPRDYRQSEHAEQQLQDRIEATLDALRVMNKDIQDLAIGFADESAVQMHTHNARFWSLSHTPRTVNTTMGSQNFFGFYALEGQSCLEKMTACKHENFKTCLLAVKAQNPTKKGIILFWDNATAHKAIEQWAWQQSIYVIYIPPYSPDLNPIERIWKSCKRYVTEQDIPKKMADLAHSFENGYQLFKVQLSFASGWLNKMKSIFSWKSAMNHSQPATS